MDEQEARSESDTIILTENSSMADILHAIIAKADGKTVKVLSNEKKE